MKTVLSMQQLLYCKICKVTGIYKLYVNIVFLLYPEAPYFLRPIRSEVVVAIGDSAVFQCLSGGAPMPSITWFKDGSIITNSGHVVFAMAGQYLVIAEAEEEDTGIYACEATNSQGTVRQRTELFVETGKTYMSLQCFHFTINVESLFMNLVFRFITVAIHCEVLKF